jgi:hypothetical protein
MHVALSALCYGEQHTLLYPYMHIHNIYIFSFIWTTTTKINFIIYTHTHTHTHTVIYFIHIGNLDQYYNGNTIIDEKFSL